MISGFFTDGLTRFIQRTDENFHPIETSAEDSLVLKDIFYLLADFNFKTRELEKAMLFYMKDLCFNSKRFDSWAGMALASSNKLEVKRQFYLGDFVNEIRCQYGYGFLIFMILD